MTLPNDKWEEIEPCMYQRRAYTAEEIERLNRRPTDLINAALGRRTSTHPSQKSGDEA